MGYIEHLSRRQFINGEWVEASNKATRDIVNPYNQEVVISVAEGTEEDAEKQF